jgi:BMFP domain-containing protein YqiC
MPNENRFFEDFARVASGALGALSGVREEVEARLKEQVERVLDRMNLVRREEFEAVQAMAAKARAAQEALEERVAALEARGAHDAPLAGPAPRRTRPTAPRKHRPVKPL